MIGFSIRRPIAVSMAYLAAALLGIAAWRNIPLELLPDTTLPRLTITSDWGGSSPETVEAFLTSPVEATVQQVRGVEKITSTSTQVQGRGSSTISVEFARGTDMNFARMELLERLGALRAELPLGASAPRVSPYVPEEFADQRRPFLSYTVTGPYTQEALRAQIDDEIAPELRQLDGVGDVRANGGRRRVLEILLDDGRTAAFNLTPLQVQQRIRELEIVREAGTVEQRGMLQTVTIRQAPDSAAELMDAVLLAEPGRVIRLRDVATVRDTYEEPRSLSRIDGYPAVTFDVTKKSGTNTVAVADDAKARIADVQPRLLAGVRLIKTNDESDDIRKQLTDLRERALVSAVVIFAVLLVFLGSFRSVLIVCATIAFSVLIAVNLMYFAGFSLNVLTLMGLAMGFGLIADNAIVVLENIFRRWRGGEAPAEAAQKGAREVVLAIFAATMTTLVVFIPFVYLQGELRVFYIPLAVVVALSLVASLVVAFSFIPALGARMLIGEHRDGDAVARVSAGGRLTPLPVSVLPDGGVGDGNAAAEPPPRLPLYVRFYAAMLRGTLRFPWSTVVMCALLVGGSYYLFDKYVQRGVLWRGFGGQSTYLSVQIMQPRGEELGRTDELARYFESHIATLSHIDRFTTQVTPQQANIRIEFADSVENSGIPEAVKEELTAYGFQFGGAEVRVYGYGPSFYGGGGSSPNYRITIFGYNYLSVLGIAEALQGQLEQFSRVRNVDVNASSGWGMGDKATEMLVTLDRDRLAMHGITVTQLGQQIGAAISGASLDGRQVPIRIGGEERDLTIKLDGYADFDVQRLLGLMIPTTAGGGVRLGDVATIEERNVLGRVERENQQYKRVVGYEFRGPQKLGDRVHESVIAATALPDGYRIEGRQEWTWGDDEAKQLYGVLAISLALVFMVTAALFESLRQPICVLLTVPMALIGVFVIFFYANASFTREAVIGVIMMGGIVVNNAILLVDRVNQLRRVELKSLADALMEGTLQRVRPILMTSASTVFGLLPLVLFSETADQNIWNALGYALIGGLTTSTFLVLTVTPAIYLLLERPKRWPRFRKPSFAQPRMQWRRRAAATTAAASAVIIAGCAGEQGTSSDAAVTRIDSAGVAIVMNHGPDRPGPFTLERRLTIGGEMDGVEAFGNLSDRVVDADAAGNLLVLDPQNHRLLTYDSAGARIRTVGREGGGPGEFRFPSALTVVGDGTAHVFDYGKRGLVTFAPDGTATEESLTSETSRAYVRRVEIDGTRRFVEAEDSGPPPGVPTGATGPAPPRTAIAPEGMTRRFVVAHAGGRQDTLLVSDRPLHPMQQVPGCRVSVSLGPIFEPVLAWAVGSGRLAYVDGSAYRADLVDGGANRVSVRRDLPMQPSTPALAEQDVGEFRVEWLGGGCSAPAAAVVEQRGVAPHVPAVRSMVIAPDGSLWVKRFAIKGDTAAVDVFGADGVYLGTLPHGSPFPAAFLPNGDLVVVARDELDISRIEVWRRSPAVARNDQ